MALLVNIRLNSNHSFPIEVNPTWSVKELKQCIGQQNSIPSNEIRILFCGQELKDHMQIQDFDLGQHSVLHAVRGQKIPAVTVVTTNGGVGLAALVEDDPSSQRQAHSRSNYFVYCKHVCKDIKPGKLRVHCSLCKQGSILLERGPCGWEDVLVPDRIAGSCQEQGCNGTKAEFYFKCAGHPSVERESAVALHLIRPNHRQVPCLTCTDICDPVLVFPCRDGHSMCLECFTNYCTVKLNDRDFIQHPTLGYTLSCPARCDDSLIEEVHHFRVLGEQQYDRYQRFGTEECLLQMGGVLCPRAGCGCGLIPEEGERRVTCQDCRFVFCRTCLNDYHDGPCGQQQTVTENADGFVVDHVHAEQARWEQQSMVTIDKTTKPCPKCAVPTEKAEKSQSGCIAPLNQWCKWIGGCMHMACSRCKYQWCWLCHDMWSLDCQTDHWFG